MLIRVPVRQSYVSPSVRISFPDDNLSKHQWSFTKLGMCIDIGEIYFWDFCEIWTELSA